MVISQLNIASKSTQKKWEYGVVRARNPSINQSREKERETQHTLTRGRQTASRTEDSAVEAGRHRVHYRTVRSTYASGSGKKFRSVKNVQTSLGVQLRCGVKAVL